MDRSETAVQIDRYSLGSTVVAALAPEFSSAEFARRFLSLVPQEHEETFDAVRLKKVLQRLADDGRIALVRRGAGLRPAWYRVSERQRLALRGGSRSGSAHSPRR
jgi:hypothetical protein